MTINTREKIARQHILSGGIPSKLNFSEATVIKEFLSDAYVCCINHEPITATSGGEICVTNLMIRFMNKVRKSKKYCNLVQFVEERTNYQLYGNGTIQKPDISIVLDNSWIYPCLTIEAKIIDKDNNDKSYYNYCTEGITRFVDTRYSWWSDAFMIGYVRDKSTLDDFNDYLKNNNSNCRKCNFIYTPCKLIGNSKNFKQSEHNRFALIPNPLIYRFNTITIWHFWMDQTPDNCIRKCFCAQDYLEEEILR